MRSSLFRKEIIATRRQKLFGDVFLAQPVSHMVISSFIFFAFIAVLLFLWLTPYQSIERVSGQLVSKGARIYAELEIPLRILNQFPLEKAVTLSYAAYPSKEFGVQQGQVVDHGQLIQLSDKGPHYTVLVEIENLNLEAYGQILPLQSGMIVQAHVMRGKQSLLSWLFRWSDMKN